MGFEWLIILNIIFYFGTIWAKGDSLICAYRYNQVAYFTIEPPNPNDIYDDLASVGNKKPTLDITKLSNNSMKYEKCQSNDYCYTFWQANESENGTTTIVMGQGCWAASNILGDCDNSLCASHRRPPKSMNNTKFCCCSSNLCNLNFTDQYVPSIEDEEDVFSHANTLKSIDYKFSEETKNKETVKLLILVLSLCALFIVILSLFSFKMLMQRKHNKNNADSRPFIDSDSKFRNDIYNVDHLKLISIIGQGRYGTVWRGTVNDEDVAVKIFLSHQKNIFCNERDIYTLSFMDNSNLLTYFGCDERINMDGNLEYLLILSYTPNGCLQDYLRNNVVDFNTFCQMALTIAKGLAHLHTAIKKGDEFKPNISHRDLNSRNILVKSDLSCCLCDFGFAMTTYPKSPNNKDMKNLSEVGTVRYMAPEVLEGAVNLIDRESALNQIDIYALGLVLWELSSRCADLYPNGVEVPSYKLPYETDVGLHPTFEQMQTLVSRHKARPLWKFIGPRSALHKLIIDTAEECWDQEPEARLTTLCVEKRIHELIYLKDHSIKAISPSYLNPTNNRLTIINNNCLNSQQNVIMHSSSEQMQSMNDSSGTNSLSQQSIDKSCEYSQGTMETMYTISPTEAPHVEQQNAKISNEIAANQIQQPIQAFQARNPCLDRNLLHKSASSSNENSHENLIERSYKHEQNPTSIFNEINSYHNQKNQLLNQQNQLNQNIGITSPVIPYVNNFANTNYSPLYNSIVTQKKPPNVYNSLNEQLSPESTNKETNKFISDFKKFLKNRFSKTDENIPKKNYGSNQRPNLVDNEEEAKRNLIMPDDIQLKNNLYRYQQSRKVSDQVIMDTQVNLTTQNEKINKQNKVLNDYKTENLISKNFKSTIVDDNVHRPTNLPLIKTTNDKNFNLKTKFETNDPSIDKQQVTTSGISQIVKERHTKYGDLLHKREPSLEHFNKVFASTNDLSRLKDPAQRIKTPGDVPPSVRRNRGKGSGSSLNKLPVNSALLNTNNRYSLYDDRMMVTVNIYDDGKHTANEDDQQILFQNCDGTYDLLNNQANLKKYESISSF